MFLLERAAIKTLVIACAFDNASELNNYNLVSILLRIYYALSTCGIGNLRWNKNKITNLLYFPVTLISLVDDGVLVRFQSNQLG